MERLSTPNQNSMMFKFTLLKFWECESPPPPTIGEAVLILEYCFKWLEARKAHKDADMKTYLDTLIPLVQKFFPDWQGPLHVPFYGKKKKDPKQTELPLTERERKIEQNNQRIEELERELEKQREVKEETKEAAQADEKTDAKIEQEEAKKRVEEKRKARKTEDSTIDKIKALIEAGINNIFLVGPAGTGKTTLCRIVAEELELPCTILSCNAGTSAAEITGFKYPEPRSSAVSKAIGIEGIIVFDEFTTLDPSIAAVANALLANNELETSTGHVVRPEGQILIATANTTGDGADRQYIGNNQIDAATLDRFVGGFVMVDYSKEYESKFDPEVVNFVQKTRETAKKAHIRRVVSTRSIIAGSKLKAAGIDWKTALLANWTEAERRLL